MMEHVRLGKKQGSLLTVVVQVLLVEFVPKQNLFKPD